MLNFLVSLAIGVFFTPYLLDSLGKSLYGLIPLTNTVISYLGVATAGLHMAVSRFVAISLERRDYHAANRTFNTAVASLWGVAALLLLPIVLLSVYADHILDVPVENVNDLRCLFTLCGISFLISTTTSPFGVGLFFRNRFDIQSWLALTSNLLRIAVTVFCFYLLGPSLASVGIAVVLASALTAVGTINSWRKLTPSLYLDPSLWNRGEFARINGATGWIIINQVGVILLVSVDLLVVNRMLGPLANTQYALALQWSVLLRGIAGTLGGLFAPDMTAHFARQDVQGLVSYTRRAVKFLGVILALPVGLVAGFSEPLLDVWVGSEYTGLASLMIVLTLPLAVNLSYLPLHNISIAANRVRVPGLIQIAAGALNIILAMWFVKFTTLGMLGVAISGGAVLALKNLVFTPLYASRILNLHRFVFLREVLPSSVASLIVAALGLGTTIIVKPDGWLQLGFAAACVSVVYAVVGYYTLFDWNERDEMRRRLDSWLSR